MVSSVASISEVLSHSTEYLCAVLCSEAALPLMLNRSLRTWPVSVSLFL